MAIRETAEITNPITKLSAQVHGRSAKGERIIDIALEVGYRSPTAFSTMFQRQFGCSPSVFFENRGERRR